jgi:hypothetical protein
MLLQGATLHLYSTSTTKIQTLKSRRPELNSVMRHTAPLSYPGTYVMNNSLGLMSVSRLAFPCTRAPEAYIKFV